MTGELTHIASKERNGAERPSFINYCLKSEVPLRQQCSTRYTAVRIKNCSKSTSAIQIAL